MHLLRFYPNSNTKYPPTKCQLFRGIPRIGSLSHERSNNSCHERSRDKNGGCDSIDFDHWTAGHSPSNEGKLVVYRPRLNVVNSWLLFWRDRSPNPNLYFHNDHSTDGQNENNKCPGKHLRSDAVRRGQQHQSHALQPCRLDRTISIENNFVRATDMNVLWVTSAHPRERTEACDRTVIARNWTGFNIGRPCTARSSACYSALGQSIQQVLDRL